MISRIWHYFRLKKSKYYRVRSDLLMEIHPDYLKVQDPDFLVAVTGEYLKRIVLSIEAIHDFKVTYPKHKVCINDYGRTLLVLYVRVKEAQTLIFALLQNDEKIKAMLEKEDEANV